MRLLCTFGTPSALEAASVGRLAAVGWRIAIRADFDPAGLAHLRMLVAACPTAVPWRTTAADYRISEPTRDEDEDFLTVSVAEAPGTRPWPWP